MNPSDLKAQCVRWAIFLETKFISSLAESEGINVQFGFFFNINSSDILGENSLITFDNFL